VIATDPADIALVSDTSGISRRPERHTQGVRLEVLMAALHELTATHEQARNDQAFTAELDGLLNSYAGRTPRPHSAAPQVRDRAELITLLREQSVELSASQVDRLVTNKPERLSM